MLGRERETVVGQEAISVVRVDLEEIGAAHALKVVDGE
jgi:hypothetical protein